MGKDTRTIRRNRSGDIFKRVDATCYINASYVEKTVENVVKRCVDDAYLNVITKRLDMNTISTL